MRKYAVLWTILVVLAFQVGLLNQAQAEAVGRLTKVEGRVDILRGGELPAILAKVNDGVETGDVIRTKCASKTQITFMDNSTLTLAPESRVAIEDYMFEPAKQKRNAVLQIFQGLVHAVVNKVYKVKDPDFIVKTNTAIMGIRGTEFGIRIQPNSSTILNLKGRLQVGNIFPEVSQLSRRAVKVAYSFGPRGGGPGWVILKDWQGTTVFRGLPPTTAFTFTKEDWELFKRQLSGWHNVCKEAEGVGGGETGTALGTLVVATGTSGGLGIQTPINLVQTPAYTPPPVPPPPVVEPPPPTPLAVPEHQNNRVRKR